MGETPASDAITPDTHFKIVTRLNPATANGLVQAETVEPRKILDSMYYKFSEFERMQGMLRSRDLDAFGPLYQTFLLDMFSTHQGTARTQEEGGKLFVAQKRGEKLVVLLPVDSPAQALTLVGNIHQHPQPVRPGDGGGVRLV